MHGYPPAGLVVVVAALGLLLPPQPARADGNGIKSGNLRFHPGIELETAYNNNVFKSYDCSRATPEQMQGRTCRPIKSSPVARLVPGLRLSTPNPGAVQFNLAAGLDIRQYLSDDSVVREQSALGWGLSGRFEVGADRPLGLLVAEDFNRVLEAGSDPGNTANNNVISNVTTVGLRIRPGGGMLEVLPGYRLRLRNYEDIPNDFFVEHGLGLQADWKFLPKTSLRLDGSIGFLEHVDDGAVPGAQKPVDSKPLRVRLGLAGLVSNNLSVVLDGGYGNSLHDSGESFEGFIGEVSGTYRFTELTRFTLRYSRDFDQTLISNFYAWNRGEGRLEIQFTPKVNAFLSGLIEHRAYSELYPLSHFGEDVEEKTNPRKLEERTDFLVRAEAAFFWFPRDWLKVNLGYRYEQLLTDAGAGIRKTYQAPDGTIRQTEVLKEVQYAQHYPYLALGVTY